MDLTLKIAIIGAIAIVIAAFIKLLGDLISKGSSGGLIFTIIILILAVIGAGGFVLSLPTPTGENTPTAAEDGDTSTAFPLTGNWSGTIKSPDGSFSTELNLSFESSCKVNEICGTYDAYQLPCSGTLTLIKTEGDSFVFLETKTKGEDWCGFCYEHVEKLAGNSISYGCSGTGLSKDIQSTGILSKP